MAGPKLIVVGSVAYDDIATPSREEKGVLGGSATYFSLASRMLIETGVVAVVGKDFGASDIALLRSRGIDLSGLETTRGKTFRWGGRYDNELYDRETLYTHLNVFADFSPRLPEEFKNAPYIFLANIDPDLQLQVLAQCTGPKFVACDTMNFWIQGKRESLLKLLPRIDALFLNDTEAFQLTGRRNLLSAARWIHEQGTQIAVIKKGENGAVVISGDDAFVAPAFLLDDVEDPTGAGDTFAGGMVGTLARLDDTSPQALRVSAAVGTVAASFCVQRFGPSRLAEISKDDLLERLTRYRGLTRVPERDI